MALRSPISFGDYLLWDRFRIGGTAEVWRATRRLGPDANRVVAVKRLLPTLAEDGELRERFIQGFAATAQLVHENIVRLYESGRVSPWDFVAMEYVSGQDLRAFFARSQQRHRFPAVEASCYIIAQACDGLHYAHQRADPVRGAMVHRDLSPENVLLGYNGSVKVTDFGLAEPRREEQSAEAPPLGKDAYLSPEQRRGAPADPRSDIYAIGVCLCELLTGQRLQRGLHLASVPPPSSQNPQIPKALDQVVMKALQADSHARYQSAAELAQALRSFGFRFGREEFSRTLQSMFQGEAEEESQRLREIEAYFPSPPGRGSG